MSYWLGIDIGTGGSRALLVRSDGSVASGVTVAHEDMLMQRPLWAEQRPQDWWNAASEAVRGVLGQAGVSGGDIRGVGLSGQMHGLTLLDAANQVIRPALIWCDQRSQDQVDWINATVGAATVVQHTANPVLTGFTAPKLLWVRDNDPASYERIRNMLLPKDYIRFMLTGEFASEVSDASGTALFDVVGRCWSKFLIDKLGIDASILPQVVESPERTGSVSAAAARQTGLARGTPVVAGAGDQAASAVGNGIVESGLVSCTIGTSGVVFAHLDQAAYDPAGRVHTFCHAVPGKWHLMGVTQGAGLSLQWFRSHLAAELANAASERGAAIYDLLTDEAEGVPPGAEGLLWLPYLMGERTPHLDPFARGCWVGITAKHTRGHLIRSILEGVAYSLNDCLGIIASLGTGVSSVRASGGGARSPLWLGILANVFRKPVVTLQTQEGSAYGAALLAMAGTGHVGSVEEACQSMIATARRIEPEAGVAAEYARSYALFEEIYPSLKGIFPKLQAQPTGLGDVPT